MPALLFFIIAVISPSGISEKGDLSLFSGSVQYIASSDNTAEAASSVQDVNFTNKVIAKKIFRKFFAGRRINNKTGFTEHSKLKYTYSQFIISYSGNAGSSRTDNSFLKFLRITKMLC